MQPQIENAVRSVARQCREPIIKATKDKPRAEHDPIITEILNFHAKQIQCLPPDTFTPKLWLTYYVRLVDKESRNDAG